MSSKTKRQAYFGDRTRFNWGFHDAVFDKQELNRPRITDSAVQDLRHVSTNYDAAYHAGYKFGLEYVRLNLATGSSEPAWLAHKGESIFQKAA